MPRLNIVFASSVCPGQYGPLCEYLHRERLANTWFLTTPGHAAANKDRIPNLISFQPDGNIVGPQSYYYSSKVERSARISRGIRARLLEFQKTQAIDVVVCHSLWGAPHFLYGEIDAAIVSYIEFPSYRAHGWDPEFPPDAAQRIGDRNMEMLHFQQVLNNDLTIVPSAYARSLFPPELADRIAVQFEGFEFAGEPFPDKPDGGRVTIGFTARDLSNAKGFDRYVRIADHFIGRGSDLRFVAIGDPAAPTYSYEPQWIERRTGGRLKTYKDYLLERFPHAGAIEFPGRLPYEAYAKALADIDVFLYPLRFGVANWGLMEILGRGGCVLASDATFIPELIASGENGLLLPDDDRAWIDAVEALSRDPERRRKFRRAAKRDSLRQHMSAVAPRYLALFERARQNRAGR